MRDRQPAEVIVAIRAVDTLAELVDLFGAESVHEAYFEAKDMWSEAVRECQRELVESAGLPGTTVTVDGTQFHVHGITHADTGHGASVHPQARASVPDGRGRSLRGVLRAGDSVDVLRGYAGGL